MQYRIPDDGESDTVKLYGQDNRGELFVSASKGHSYIRTKNV